MDGSTDRERAAEKMAALQQVQQRENSAGRWLQRLEDATTRLLENLEQLDTALRPVLIEAELTPAPPSENSADSVLGHRLAMLTQQVDQAGTYALHLRQRVDL